MKKRTRSFGFAIACAAAFMSSPVQAYPCDAKEYSTFSAWVALWMRTDEGDFEREDFMTDEIFPHYFEATELAEQGDYEAACDILVKLIKENDIPLAGR